jgi:prepilin-type N-terminal cleavage/methylation domain-containing protein
MRAMRQRGFTLVEIMIVMLVIGIMLAIMVPNFMKARSVSRHNAILFNLEQLDRAKEQCAIERGAVTGNRSTCSATILRNTYLRQYPSSNTPIRGAYAPRQVGAPATFRNRTAAWWRANATYIMLL